MTYAQMIHLRVDAHQWKFPVRPVGERREQELMINTGDPQFEQRDALAAFVALKKKQFLHDNAGIR